MADAFDDRWQPAGARVLDPAEVAAALQSVHEAFTDFPSPLPPFTLELADAIRLLQPDRSPALTPDDRQFLLQVVDELGAALSGLLDETRPLHGSPHGGNWLPAARGLLLLDFETACRGPSEWDIGALDDRAAAFFPEADLELIALLRMRSACVAAKCWVEPNRAPEVFDAAHVHLKLLRGQPLRLTKAHALGIPRRRGAAAGFPAVNRRIEQTADLISATGQQFGDRASTSQPMGCQNRDLPANPA